MNKTQKTILGMIGLITVCTLAGVGAIFASDFLNYWQEPLAPPLSLATWTPASPAWSTPLPSPTLAPLSASLPVYVAPPINAPAQSAAAVPSAAGLASVPVETAIPQAYQPGTPLCGGPPAMLLLAIGADTRSSGYTYGLADMIRIVRIDFVTPSVSVLEIPRDLWVEIPDIADNLKGQDHERLNQAYLYGNRGFGYTDDPAQGPGLLARTLDLNFGVRADHYLAINMYTFVRVVNQLGGIDVYLPHAVDGREADQKKRDDLVFSAGWHHLNGDQALMLGRIRMDGVFARAEAQNYVLCGLRDKLLSPRVVPRIPELIDAFMDNVQTDLSPEQISQLACLGPQIPRENIRFLSVPQEYFKGTRIYDPVFKGRVFIWDVDFDTLRLYVDAFQKGNWLEASAADASPSDSPSVLQCP